MACDVVEVKCAEGYILDLAFEDGRHARVDLSPYAAKGGVFRRFSDPNYFKQVKVNLELGTLCWPDGVDIAPETLYALATHSTGIAGHR